MKKSKLFQYAILWHPTEKQVKDDSAKSKILTELTIVLAADDKEVAILAARKITDEYLDQLDQVEVIVRPF
jgi:hypothetical protein